MSEKNTYKDAFDYAMNELHEQYISEDKESDFIFNFNVNYVEDTIDTITVSVASPFMKNQVTSKGSLEIIEKKLREVTGLDNLKINCIVKNESHSNKESEKKEIKKVVEIKENKAENIPSEEAPKLNKKHPLLQEEYTFEKFITGDNSNFAYNASLAVAKNPGKQYNPILLYGGSGLGKTHLMQSIGNYIYNNGGEKLKICYVSAESFTNEFIMSTKENKTNAFKNKYRNLDVLLLDDIHFLQNKDATQEELFYTFNALHEKHAQMVFTCDRPIKEIKNLATRLVSRLANGLCIDLQPPNYETRVAILQKKIELKGYNLNFEIIDYIAKNVETNVRELEAALNKVFGYADLVGQNPTLEIAKNLLKDIIESNNENISLDLIQKIVADNHQISIADLKSKKRDKKYVIPRQIAIYIARELTEISYTELGNEFGGKDHSTIMTAYKKVSELIKTDPSLDSKIQLYIREIKEYRR
ncbi:MAG: chromosomal replication initiator protein DnaA [Treponema sp.]|uniref:chromosomal replication initiator protein DnaA n=1 Tax=Treponema sp. TaxID=166 RepID=UPI00298D7B6E|nr:chromosomal replication initiator protein DnaA [Treponema sp.]MCQ2601428.1 chromosomal replication initiator protein DnaA [Treponema sp.]